jgi:hypothetical protein
MMPSICCLAWMVCLICIVDIMLIWLDGRNQYALGHTNWDPSYNFVGCCQILLRSDCVSPWESKGPAYISELTWVCWQWWNEHTLPECRLYMLLQKKSYWETLQELSTSNALPSPKSCSLDSSQWMDHNWRTCCACMAHNNTRHWNISH